MTEIQGEVVRLPMVCIHDKGDSTERHDAASTLRSKVKALLGSDTHPVTDADFVSSVVGNLWWKWQADIEFGCDQWFGVYAKIEHLVPKEERTDDLPKWRTVLRVSCECDRVEDGLAAIYEWFHENRKPDEE